MPSERIQRRIDSLLDQAEEAANRKEWAASSEFAREVMALDQDNADAGALLQAAERMLGSDGNAPSTPAALPTSAPAAAQPESFVRGRYHVRRFLGEGGKKRVFLAHDESLDRDVAFALIKTAGLDATGRERIVREAQAMGRMGSHPHVVTIFEIGEEGGAPYVVTELLGGGDVEGLLEKAEGEITLERALAIGKDVCDGLVFAHSQGIVHRDLKPGNVWLTAEGVAKIGDFGLAVNLGRSRLTQHGLMVGTVAYMPPEQALGGEVTPQSDLYSLGAMLYELVTGKPPFQADDPTAVISQHINTPPVAPSYQSEHCPPELEALILHLLAKVPADRPASAAEVLAALERVDPAAESAHHSGSGVNPLDRLARGAFVGRERELERLRGAFDNAFAGHGSVVMLVGEPGIGKTRTTMELETYARLRGAQVLWGRADESSGAPPYRPWVQVATAYRDQNPEETRRREWGPYAVELQRIFRGLRDLFPNLPEPPETESEETQFQLFDAMSDFARGVATRVPLLIVLDDLHWADRATLRMLAHLARDIARSRVLILGTYRDTDLDRTHPLSQTLGELNREQLFTRIPLRGLTEPETGAYIAATANVEPAPALVRKIHEETEGNPFFLAEVVNLLAQEGTLARAGSASISDLAIPEGVKEALGRRLDRLSAEANALLTLAAVAGREFDHALLVALTGQDDEAVLTLVEEALAGRVIEETGAAGQYRFTHALMQETLAGELSAARQVRLHGQIAETLDRLSGERADAPMVARLARHYAESAVLNRTHASQAARYSRLAAEQAEAALGYDEAIRHYERCLAIIADAREPLGEDEAALWDALAQCKKRTGQSAAGRAALERALTLYAERGDAHAQARAWSRFMEGVPAAARAEQALLGTLTAALGDADSVALCHLLAWQARFDLGPAGDALAARAQAMATRLALTGDDYPLELEGRPIIVRRERGQFREAGALSAAMVAPPGGTRAFSRANMRSNSLGWAGEIDAQAASRDEYLTDARTYRRRSLEAAGVTDLARIAWLRGERARCDQLLSEIAVEAFVPPGALAAVIAFTAGDTGEALRRLPRADHPDFTPQYAGAAAALRSTILLAQGERDAASGALAQARLSAWDDAEFLPRLFMLSCAEDPIVEIGDAAFARHVADSLARLPALRSFTVCGSGNPDVLRGRLALRFGEVDEAETHFRTGLEWASRPDVRFVLHQGRCHQGLAEVAERRGDHALAMEHLDAAGALFSAHGGAKLYLDQVLAKKQFLKA